MRAGIATLLLATSVLAERYAFDVDISDSSGLWKYSGPWTANCSDASHNIPLDRRDLVSLDTFCTSVKVNATVAGSNSSVVLVADGAEVTGYPDLRADYPSPSNASIKLRSNANQRGNLVLHGATITTELESDATTFEDVVVGHTRFTMADDVILQATDLGVRASFIKITGDIGKDAGRTFVSIEYSENPMAVHEIYPANECREDPLDEVLWFAPLDPGRNYTLTIIRTGKLAAWSTFNVAVYFSAWNKSCSESVRPWHCRWVRSRRWVNNNWVIGSVAVFMFFLIKGLLWLALGGGLFVSIRQLWRRVRRQPASGEQDPLLDPEAAEERQQENSD